MSNIDEAINDIVPLVKSFCLRNIGFQKCFDSFEDMVSDCVMICIKRYPKYDEKRGALATFVYTVCKSHCLHKLAKLKRHNFAENNVLSLDEPLNDNSIDTFLDSVEDKSAKVDKDWEFLKFVSRNIPELLKRHINGETYVDIAKDYGVSRQAIGLRISQERTKLLKLIDNYNKYGDKVRVVSRADLMRDIMKVTKCSERTAYRRVDKYVRTGKCDENIAYLFKNVKIKGVN